MSSPISRIGSQRPVTRDEGSNGHDQVSKRLDGPNGSQATQTARPVNQKVMDVAKMYERQFLGEMFKAMRSTVSETDKPSMAQNIYNSQRDEQYVDAWSENGGLGFSNIIYNQIMERYFGQTQQGQALRKQGPIQITNRPIASVSQVKNGVATPIAPRAPSAPAAPANVRANPDVANQAAASANVRLKPDVAQSGELKGEEKSLAAETRTNEVRTVENTEPMPAPTPPQADTRSTQERIAAGEHFPEGATAKSQTSVTAREANANVNSNVTPNMNVSEQTALQIEVRPSPTGQPAKIQAPWDATVVRAAKLDGQRTAVTLEHGEGLRSTLVFDGVLSAGATPGQKIPRGESIATLNQDAKSFLWNLAPTGSNPPQSQAQSATQGPSQIE